MRTCGFYVQLLVQSAATSKAFVGEPRSFQPKSLALRERQQRSQGKNTISMSLQRDDVVSTYYDDVKQSPKTAGDVGNGSSESKVTNNDSTSLPKIHLPSHLVSKLDIDPLLRHVSTYACTKRGKDAILSLLPTSSSSALEQYLNKKGNKPSLFGRSQQSRRGWYQNGELTRSSTAGKATITFPIAQSANEATFEYELVRQAMELLRSQSSHTNKIPLPPMFQFRNVDSISYDSDDDEWLYLCLHPLPVGADIMEEINLYMIFQAERVTKMLLDTYEWAMDERLADCAFLLSDVIVKPMLQSNGENNETEQEQIGNPESVVYSLYQLHDSLNGAIDIVREGSSSYQFRLSTRDGRFEELNALRQKEEEYLRRLNKVGTSSTEKAHANKLAMIQNEISILEQNIKRTLVAAMMHAAPHVELAFAALARLDVLFAKAAFGLEWNGVIPEVAEEGRVIVHKFVHPVLAIEKKFESETGSKPTPVVPIDLRLPGNGSYQALMISGPNSGGKTLALKSFGLAAVMVKLALPITLAQMPNDDPIVVDFFDDIDVEVGDNQSLVSGESTLMARLNSLSALIEKSSMGSDSWTRRLVLLDELGGGTDPVAGAAISQAILERILVNIKCNIVATTHSQELKSLALTNDKFQSACVTLDSQPSSSLGQTTADAMQYNRRPTYQLIYGATGESYALGAASRCHPPLPIDVIERAAQLMAKDDSGNTLRSHLDALDREITATNTARQEVEAMRRELILEKEDTLAKLQSASMYLSRMESRMQSIFETLSKDESRNAFELVGNSLDELKVVRKKVKTEEELLAEKGLRRVPDNYSFYDGETVVIVADGEFKGYNAVVKLQDIESSNAYDSTITVIPTLDLFSLDEEGELLELRRTDIAIWDYPEQFGEPSVRASSNTSRSSSSKKVMSLLSSLNVGNKATSNNVDTSNNSFSSSRQRKASRKGKKKK